MRVLKVSALFWFVPVVVHGFVTNPGKVQPTRSYSQLFAAPAKDVWILPTEEDVTQAVNEIVESAAKKAIAERGHFALAIPGGSVLKVLSNLEPSGDWVPKTTLAYVNHKCVPIDDASNAIHAKARKMFLDRWGLDNVITLGGTDDAVKESAEYEAKLKAIPDSVLPRDADGFPVFDLCLIGVGDDGHIGSLYPNRDEINEDQRWVVGVEMKKPPGISLTLPVMQRAKCSVISAAGQSEKYPKGKASAMRLAIEDASITPRDFPASALRQTAIWILDEPNASEMPGLKRSTREEVQVA